MTTHAVTTAILPPPPVEVGRAEFDAIASLVRDAQEQNTTILNRLTECRDKGIVPRRESNFLIDKVIEGAVAVIGKTVRAGQKGKLTTDSDLTKAHKYALDNKAKLGGNWVADLIMHKDFSQLFAAQVDSPFGIPEVLSVIGGYLDVEEVTTEEGKKLVWRAEAVFQTFQRESAFSVLSILSSQLESRRSLPLPHEMALYVGCRYVLHNDSETQAVQNVITTIFRNIQQVQVAALPTPAEWCELLNRGELDFKEKSSDEILRELKEARARSLMVSLQALLNVPAGAPQRTMKPFEAKYFPETDKIVFSLNDKKIALLPFFLTETLKHYRGRGTVICVVLQDMTGEKKDPVFKADEAAKANNVCPATEDAEVHSMDPNGTCLFRFFPNEPALELRPIRGRLEMLTEPFVRIFLDAGITLSLRDLQGALFNNLVGNRECYNFDRKNWDLEIYPFARKLLEKRSYHNFPVTIAQAGQPGPAQIPFLFYLAFEHQTRYLPGFQITPFEFLLQMGADLTVVAEDENLKKWGLIETVMKWGPAFKGDGFMEDSSCWKEGTIKFVQAFERTETRPTAQILYDIFRFADRSKFAETVKFGLKYSVLIDQLLAKEFDARKKLEDAGATVGLEILNAVCEQLKK
jgi:hypothetical protein